MISRILASFVLMVCAITPTMAAEPQTIDFKKLILDGADLANTEASVRVAGVYVGIGEFEMLYSPDHTAQSVSGDAMRLLTQDSPRAVREYFYGCRAAIEKAQNRGDYGIDGCVVWVVGHMTTCVLKINASAEFPCLVVEDAGQDKRP